MAYGQDRPNILVIVADDLGYSDLACFGGEISTPNIDALAARGVLFSNFHTAPTCAPTRAMLFSGNDNHTAGMGSQMRTTGEYGYEGHLSDRIVPFPQILLESGYHTSIAGKWHLGMRAEDNAHAKGFEQSFTLLPGAGNHYDDQGLFKEHPISPYTENGDSINWPEGAYSTDFYTEKIIEYIDQYKEDPDPFFSIATYTSPHWPLQVDSKFWHKYKGKYDEGYEVLRTKRFNKLKEIGLIQKEAILPAPHPSVKPWDSLSKDEKKKESRKMELYAGMVDNLDYNIGKLIEYLKSTDQYDQTLIVFMSDNGAAANDFYNNSYFSPFLREHFNDDYLSMGLPDSFISYGPQWAEAGSAAFRYYKNYTTDGGIRTPLIISGPGVLHKKKPVTELVTIMDLAPTFIELGKTIYPVQIGDRMISPMKGESLVDFLKGVSNTAHSKDYVYIVEQGGHATVMKGPWKIVCQPGEEPWKFELFNTQMDLSEENDLSSSYPKKRKELDQLWEAYKKELLILEP